MGKQISYMTLIEVHHRPMGAHDHAYQFLLSLIPSGYSFADVFQSIHVHPIDSPSTRGCLYSVEWNGVME